MELKLNIQNKIFLGGSLASIFVFTLSFISYISMENLIDTSNWVKHTHQVISNASSIEKLVVDMETGQRGFLIAGKEEFLEPYESGERLLSSILQDTKTLVSDNPAQVEKLIEIEQTINFWKEKAGIPEIEARRKVNQKTVSMSEVFSLVISKVGKNIMDDIRRQLHLFKQEEFHLMELRELEASKNINLARKVIVLGTGIVFILSFIWSLWVSKIISKPVKILKNATDSINRGIYPNNIHIDSKDEIADFKNTFKKMINSIKKKEDDILSKKEEAEKASNAKSEFLARMSHELRTPMNAILGFTQLLEISSNDIEKTNLSMVSSAGNHLLSLIDEVLDLSSIESEDMKPSIERVNIASIVDCVISLSKPLAKEKEVSLEHHENSQYPIFVEVDPLRFKQVVLNLVSNAIKYNNPEGSVVISYKKQKIGMMRLGIKDTGHGIAEDKKDKLFKPFERFDPNAEHIEGTGIGLTISKKLIEMMGGIIGYQSVPEGGSYFYVDVPVSKEPV